MRPSLALVGFAFLAGIVPANAHAAPAPARDAWSCPSGATLRVESTVEGPATWHVCRDGAGRAQGPSRMTFADGRLRNVGAYRSGEMDGHWRYYDANGAVEGEGDWVRGKREGRWQWRDANGSRTEEYRANLEHGRFTRWFKSGVVAEDGEHAFGKRIGLWRTWHPGGLLASESFYVAGEQHGPATTYHASGAVSSRAEYRAGALHGRVTSFFESGAKSSEGDYDAGRETGHWTYWNADGSIAAEGSMIAGRRQGPWQVNGRTVFFERGREGKLRPCPAGSSEHDQCVARCCDLTARWCEKPDGTRVGPYDLWDPSGKLVRSTWTPP